MREIILLKSGEIALKGLNKGTFEDRLIRNCRQRLRSVGEFNITKAQSTLYAEPIFPQLVDLDDAVLALQNVFGFATMSRAAVVEKDMEEIQKATVEYLKEEITEAKTFKVEAKRADKKFPLKSPEICDEVGGYVLEHFPHITVDVKNPDLVITVEIREKSAYIRGGKLQGAGGMPVGSSGKAMLLMSGGIDSPVAGHMMAKRGVEIEAIHFTAPPYTGELAKQKVITLCGKMGRYTGRIRLHIVHFTAAQEAIRDNCPEELFTVIMRRYMMKIAEKLAEENDCTALITGESVAQVASQTLAAIACTDIATEMPVLRPLIGMDKSEIIAIAQRIGTFETSVLPYEDCCTVFTPKHPRTKPKIGMILAAEEALDSEKLINEALASIKTLDITIEA